MSPTNPVISMPLFLVDLKTNFRFHFASFTLIDTYADKTFM